MKRKHQHTKGHQKGQGKGFRGRRGSKIPLNQRYEEKFRSNEAERDQSRNEGKKKNEKGIVGEKSKKSDMEMSPERVKRPAKEW